MHTYQPYKPVLMLLWLRVYVGDKSVWASEFAMNKPPWISRVSGLYVDKPTHISTVPPSLGRDSLK